MTEDQKCALSAELRMARSRFQRLGSKVYPKLCEDLMTELIEPTHTCGWYNRQLQRLCSVEVLTLANNFPHFRGINRSPEEHESVTWRKHKKST